MKSNAALLQVRRGVDRADIYSIALSPNVQWLAVSSDKGTVHIFSLRVRVIGEDAHSTEHETSSNSLQPLVAPASGANPGSSLSFLRGKVEIRRILKKLLFTVNMYDMPRFFLRTAYGMKGQKDKLY